MHDGLDAYMTVNNLTVVRASTGTSDMTTPILLYNETSGTNTPTDPTCVRNSPTKWSYAWDAMGRITAIRQAVADLQSRVAAPSPTLPSSEGRPVMRVSD